MNKLNSSIRGRTRSVSGAPTGRPRAKRQVRSDGQSVRNDGQYPGVPRDPFTPVRLRSGAGKQVAVAAAYSSGQRVGAPRMSGTRDSVRIVHRELIGSITGTVGFTVASAIPLNPGLSGSFPWLSSQAQSWERYRFNKLRFCYFTRTGSSTPGSVLLVPDYDASDAQPVSEQVASTYEDVEEDAPWKDICCELRLSALNALGPSKFVRTGQLLANQDVKTYDSGNFFLVTTDGTAVPWGKLWVEYDITLMTPQLPPGGGGALQAQAGTSTAPTTANMLASPTFVANSSNLFTIAGEVLTFLVAGDYLVVYNVLGTTCTQTSIPVSSIADNLYSQEAGTGTASMTQVLQTVMLVGSTLTFNNTLVAGTSASLFVSLLPSNLGAV